METEEPGYFAVDVGGTFTDIIEVTRVGEIRTLKVPTSVAPETGILEALPTISNGARLVHGSTVATNAVLERKGARTALVATAGFSDVVEIGRQDRPSLYSLEVVRPPPLVPRSLRFEVDERLGPGGKVQRELEPSEVSSVAAALERSKAGSAAICLLYSFENAKHELMIERALAERGIRVSTSSSVLPEYREYERMSTTVINAYVSPVMEGYLERLLEGLERRGFASLRLMHSAGGTVSSNLALKRPVDLVLSGPAGGVVAAGWLGACKGTGRVISFDMGGTSTDVSLISDKPAVTRETLVAGLPVALPMIDIHTIGAGGGSIAYLDRAGVLKVGPRSAGAEPGPACYGRGDMPTVTDANLLLGRLEPDRFLGGRMKLDPERSRGSFERLSGTKDIAKAAGAVLEIALSNMEAAVKKVSLQRGHDPRDFTLVAFGGAGPMHACELAGRLEIPRVIVPTHPGLFSSMGMLLSNPGRDFSRTFISGIDPGGLASLNDVFCDLDRQAAAEMVQEGFPADTLEFARYLDMRYEGQSHQVEIPARRMEAESIRDAFDSVYGEAYGYLKPDSPVEVVNVRLRCRAQATRFSLPPAPAGSPGGQPSPVAFTYLTFDREERAGVFDRSLLGAQDRISGPALVLQDDTTTVLPPNWQAAVDEMGNLDLEKI